MKNKISKTQIFFLVFAFMAAPYISYAAEFSLSIPEVVGIGREAEISVVFDTQGEMVNAVSGEVIVPENIVEIVIVHDGGSIVSFWVDRPEVQDNKISFSGVIPGGFSGKTDSLFRIIVLGIVPGTGSVFFRDVKVFLSDGAGQNSNLTVSDEITEDQIQLLTYDVIPPEKFEPVIVQDPDIYDGRHAVVFVAQDKGSGIGYYEVQESKTGEIVDSQWVRAESPHALTDQSLKSYVFVKAVDREGNIRVEVLQPTRPDLTPALYGILVLAAILVVYRLIKRRKKKNEFQGT